MHLEREPKLERERLIARERLVGVRRAFPEMWLTCGVRPGAVNTVNYQESCTKCHSMLLQPLLLSLLS